MLVNVVTADSVTHGARLIIGVVNTKPTNEQMQEMLRHYLHHNAIGPDGRQLLGADLEAAFNAYTTTSNEYEVAEPPKANKPALTWSIIDQFNYSYYFDNEVVVSTVYLERSNLGDLRLRRHLMYTFHDEVLPLDREQDFVFNDYWMRNRILALPYGFVVGVMGHGGTGLLGLANVLQLKYNTDHYATNQDLDVIEAG